MPFPAARVVDMHVCPMVTGIVPHVGGPVLPPGAITVLIGGLPAARAGDMCMCIGPPDVIAMGYPTVLIKGSPAAFLGSLTAHGGSIIVGYPIVLYGAPPAAAAPSASAIAAAVNPGNSTVNCGNIIDAAIDRLDGTNPNAVAPTPRDGSFDAIAARHGTTFQWGYNLQNAFNLAQQGGPGTTLIVGIDYGTDASGNPRGSHVVTMTNQGGQVSIIEGQNWGAGNPAGAITDPAAAQTRYNPANVGIALVQ